MITDKNDKANDNGQRKKLMYENNEAIEWLI